MRTKADKTLTYVTLAPSVKRQAKMAAARLGISLSDYVGRLIEADAKATGLADLVADKQEESADGRA